MMFQCPHCKTMNGVAAQFLGQLLDFDKYRIVCAKCDHEYYVRKMVEYVIDPPIKEENKQ